MKNGIVVLDFGSQVTQLIARKLRELGFYSELLPFNADLEKIRKLEPAGIILSGGPSSVNEPDAPRRSLRELEEIAPILGICYGMQLIAQEYGGAVEGSAYREYGFNNIHWQHHLVSTIPHEHKVWMSHGDVVKSVPAGFKVNAISEQGHPAVISCGKIWGVQFHPEVSHTDFGLELLEGFTKELCGLEPNWSPRQITDHLRAMILERVPAGDQVLVGLSGGVDSSVVATLLTKVLGAERVHCVFINNGLLRKNEFESVLATYKKLGLHVKGVDATRAFLSALKGVEDPEAKRKHIGRVFIEVFQDAVKDIGRVEWLAQGTLYPDVIESVSPRGASVTIKSHHNVGGLPKTMNLKLIEPLRELFKDEVRKIGKELGLPQDVLWRHPFPGPGLAVRIIGEVTEEDLNVLRDCDDIFIRTLKEKNLYDRIWQAFCVLLPVKTVGVQGDARTYEKVLALRAVTSNDGMTADWFPFEANFLREISNRITNEVKGINRVVYDITSKPPGTIEWE